MSDQKSLSFGAFLKTIADAGDSPFPTPDSLARKKQAQQQLKAHYGSEYVSRPTKVKSALGVTSGSIGGYLVPPALTTRLLRALAQESVFLRRGDVTPMSGMTTLVPVVDATTVQTSPTPQFFGGISLTWGASQAPAETEPKFRSTELTAWDLLGYVVISNQLLTDMGEAENKLLDLFGRAATWHAEYAFLQGSGAGQLMPLGILNAPALVKVTRSGSGALAAADVAGLASKLLPYSWKNAIWLVSPSALLKLVSISSFYLNSDGESSDGLVGHLLSRPCFVSDRLPTLGTAGDLLFFDPSLYLIGLRSEVLVEVSKYDPTSWRSNQSTVRIWMRCDGKPALDNSVKLPSAEVVSPFVCLTTL